MSNEAAQSNERMHEDEQSEREDQNDVTAQHEQTSSDRQADVDAVETTSAEPSSDVEALQAELDEKDQRLQESAERLQRLQADFENYKKRVARERDEQLRRAENEILLAILPVYDSFDRAFSAYERDGDEQAFVEGMERVFAQFRDALAAQDVHPIDAEGQPFDPSRHEALMSAESDEHPPNTVMEAFERGYVRGHEVLRPSRVKVSRPSTSTAPTEASAETGGDDEATDGPESEPDQDEGGTD